MLVTSLYCFFMDAWMNYRSRVNSERLPHEHRSLQSATLSNRTQRSQLCASEMAQPLSSVSLLFREQSASPSMEKITHSVKYTAATSTFGTAGARIIMG